MADPRFFHNHGPFALSRVLEVSGATPGASSVDLATPVHDLAPLEQATIQHLSFFDNPKYTEAFRITRAGFCFARTSAQKDAPGGLCVLVTDEPYAAYARAAQLFYPAGFTAHISPHAHIGEQVTIGEGTRIEAGAWIGDGVVIGAHCFIGANATLSHTVMGDRVIIHPGAHIGQDGFGFAPTKQGLIKVPQLGRVVIGNDVEIGAGTCIDRGAGPDTIIMDGAKIDNLVMIAHNCTIGRSAVIVGQVGISGSTHIGDGVMIGGQAGLAGHLSIGAGAKIAARAGLMRDVPTGEAVGGTPAVPIREWHRQTAALAALARKKGEPRE